MYSLRLLLTALMLLGIVLSVGISSWFSTQDARHQIEELFDAQMVQTAKLLGLFYHYEVPQEHEAALLLKPRVLQVPTSGAESFTEQADALKLAYEHKLAFQIWSRDKRVLFLSDNVGAEPLTEFTQGYHRRSYGGELWHVFSYYSPEDSIWIITAQQDEVRQELVSQIMHNAVVVPALVVPFMLLIISLISYWLFRPISRLEKILSARSARDLTPLTLPLPRELMPVRAALNLYIGSIARFLERERRFSADAAHEFKTPLSVIKLHQDGLREMLADMPQAKVHLNAIDAGVERLSHTLEQLLLLARVDSLDELHLEPCSVLNLVEDSLNQLMPLITDYEWQIEVDPGFTIQAEPFYLELVFKNLLENACKYSPQASLIEVSAHRIGKEVEIRIADRGEGMTSEQLANAVERFYRVNENQGNGSGLGLSICSHILELHGGRLSLAQRSGGGLIVSLRLPAACP
ncbi:ATP-binding protein [Shewanella sp. AS16]|uniref:ATP-binding protein n=1 Tax=Shewanella sp. AS16 TaxID=2907625 RepID=UPI001F18988B|nr:ATP-binding protein [Shewanella sp. AS16]MCE9687237.1 ATP-binding protein [Shewanella sp. AS16]